MNEFKISLSNQCKDCSEGQFWAGYYYAKIEAKKNERTERSRRRAER